MGGRRPLLYKEVYIAVIVFIIVTSSAGVYLLTREGKEKRHPGEEERTSPEDWVSRWLAYEGTSEVVHESHPPTLLKREVRLNSSSRTGGVLPASSQPPPGNATSYTQELPFSLFEEQAGPVVYSVGEKLYYVDTAGCLRVFNLSTGEILKRLDFGGIPTDFIAVEDLGLLLLMDPPGVSLSKLLFYGEEMPELSGRIVFLNLAEGRPLFFTRLPGHPLDLYLKGSFLYIVTAFLRLEGDYPGTQLALYGCDLSTPGEVELSEFIRFTGERWWWLDGWALFKNGSREELLNITPRGAYRRGWLTIPSHYGPTVVNLYPPYIRIAFPYQGEIYFYPLPVGMESQDEEIPSQRVYLGGIGFSIDYITFLGRYASASAFAYGGSTPRLFDASSPENFTYLGEIPVEGGEIPHRLGDYLLVVQSMYHQVSLLRWQEPSTFEVLSRRGISTYHLLTTVYPRGDVYLFGDRVVFTVNGMTGDGVTGSVIAVLRINLTGGEIWQEGTYLCPPMLNFGMISVTEGDGAYMFLYDFYSYYSPSPLIYMAALGVDEELRVLYPHYIPLKMLPLPRGFLLAGFYPEEGTTTLRYYPDRWNGSGPPQEELRLGISVKNIYRRVDFFPGDGYTDIFLTTGEAGEGMEGRGNVSFFRVASCCSGLTLSITAPGLIQMVNETLLKIVKTGENRYIIAAKNSSHIIIRSLDLSSAHGVQNITTAQLYLQGYPSWRVYLVGDELYLFYYAEFLWFEGESTGYIKVNISSGAYTCGNISAFPVGEWKGSHIVLSWDVEGYYLEKVEDVGEGRFKITWSVTLPDPPAYASLNGGMLGLILGPQYFSWGVFLAGPYVQEGLMNISQIVLAVNLTGEGVEVVDSYLSAGVSKISISGGSLQAIYSTGVYILPDITFLGDTAGEAVTVATSPENTYIMTEGQLYWSGPEGLVPVEL